jgi:hypothetical protein
MELGQEAALQYLLFPWIRQKKWIAPPWAMSASFIDLDVAIL